MRVGIIALLQESNSFLSERTRLEHFELDTLLTGDAVRDRFAGGHHEISGFFAALDRAGVEAAPIFAARALPYGVISDETWRRLMEMLFTHLERAGRCDGYLVAAHGATVSETAPDADGYWLSLLRERVGPSIPIVGTLDPHANLSSAMVGACDALVAYRTNPHVDQFQCGEAAASLLVRALRGKVRPTQAAAFPPLSINISKQDTSAPPCRPIFDLADRMLETPGVLLNSVLLGFPYADVAEMGAATLVVTDDDPALAQAVADELAERLWAEREQFLPDLLSAEEAVRQAASLNGPVCLLDMGDNVGGGSPGDGAWLVHAIAAQSINDSLVCLCDPPAVSRCAAAGVGSSLTLSVGARSGPLQGRPFEAEFTVVGLYDGKFVETEPRHGGHASFDQGRSAVVRTSAGLTVLLTSLRMAPFSLAQITSCGLDPADFQIIVAKGVVAPVAAYSSVCKHFIRVNTPGVTTADVSQLHYKNRRRPLYPFETAFAWSPNLSRRSHQ